MLPLEGKAGAVIACMNDFRDFLIGSDPVQVEHHWQSMYVHSFYRAGPVIGSVTFHQRIVRAGRVVQSKCEK